MRLEIVSGITFLPLICWARYRNVVDTRNIVQKGRTFRLITLGKSDEHSGAADE